MRSDLIPGTDAPKKMTVSFSDLSPKDHTPTINSELIISKLKTIICNCVVKCSFMKNLFF